MKKIILYVAFLFPISTMAQIDVVKDDLLGVWTGTKVVSSGNTTELNSAYYLTYEL